MNQLKIETIKLVYRGIKSRKITNIIADPIEKLPIRYANGFPRCAFGTMGQGHTQHGALLVETKEDSTLFEVGKIYPEFIFERFLPIIRESGNRLHRINKKIEQTKLEWVGNEDFEI